MEALRWPRHKGPDRRWPGLSTKARGDLANAAPWAKELPHGMGARNRPAIALSPMAQHLLSGGCW
eukprot:14260568-Alexandrium_andersonii.AAC.1